MGNIIDTSAASTGVGTVFGPAVTLGTLLETNDVIPLYKGGMALVPDEVDGTTQLDGSFEPVAVP